MIRLSTSCICEKLCRLSVGKEVLLFIKGSASSIPFTFVNCDHRCVTGFSNGNFLKVDCKKVAAVTFPPICTVTTTTFTNPATITIPGTGTQGPASPYPSQIVVSGLTGTIIQVTVTFNNLSSTFPADINALLVGPNGENIILMASTGSSADINNVTLIFDDNALTPLPSNAQIVSGTYQPTNYGIVTPFTPPAPSPPYGSSLSVFNGTNPNGTWNLFVFDQFEDDVGVLEGGWELNITTCERGATSVAGVQANRSVDISDQNAKLAETKLLSSEEIAQKQEKMEFIKKLKKG